MLPFHGSDPGSNPGGSVIVFCGKLFKLIKWLLFMKKGFALLFLMIFCVGMVMALDFNVSTFCNEEIPDSYALPNKAPFSNEVVNVYLLEESIGYVVLKDKKIESYGCGENEGPTYKIFIESEEVVEKILDSENMINEYNEQRAEGGLRVEGVGAWRSVKLFFINLFSKFF